MADIDTSKEAVAAKVSLMRHKAFREVGGFLQTDRGLAENADLIEALSRDLEAMRAERDALRFRAQNAEAEQSAAETAYSVAMRQLSAEDAAIAHLTARVKELEEALHEIKGSASPDHWVPQYQHCVDVARAALSREGGE